MVDTCARCGAALGIGRFCLNCGHPVGEAVRTDDFFAFRGEADPPSEHLSSERPVGPRPSAEDEGGGLHWGFWALAAVLSVLAVLSLSTLLAPDDEPEPRPPAPTPTGEQEPDRPRARAPRADPANLVGGARVAVPVTAPPTTDLDGSPVVFEPGNLVDRRAPTAWRMPGSGVGTVVTITLPRKVRLERVGLINGYAKEVAGVDWYPQNRRVLGVTWRFDEGPPVRQTFAERRAMQQMRIRPVVTRTVRITITAVTAPGSGSLGRDYTALSEVALIGTPAR